MLGINYGEGRSWETSPQKGELQDHRKVTNHSPETLVWVNKSETSGKPDTSNCQSGAMKQS